MNHQITLEELGIIPRQETSTEKRIDRTKYACFCGECVCQHCANNVECSDKCTGESDFGCFNCDDCKGYDGKGIDNWKPECNRYKITEQHAKALRSRFRIVK